MALFTVAGGNADDLVRACLHHRSVASLALAFECSDGDVELDPQLRADLDDILDDAFRPGSPPERRRLIAGVLASRHLSAALPAADGARLCLTPVPTGLWWLFLQDHPDRVPDGPCPSDGRTTAPVLGLHDDDALPFLAWLNDIVPAEGGLAFQLPTAEQLRDHFAQLRDQGRRAPVVRAFGRSDPGHDTVEGVEPVAADGNDNPWPVFTAWPAHLAQAVRADIADRDRLGRWIFGAVRAVTAARRGEWRPGIGPSGVTSVADGEAEAVRAELIRLAGALARAGRIAPTGADVRDLDAERDLDALIASRRSRANPSYPGWIRDTTQFHPDRDRVAADLDLALAHRTGAHAHPTPLDAAADEAVSGQLLAGGSFAEVTPARVETWVSKRLLPDWVMRLHDRRKHLLAERPFQVASISLGASRLGRRGARDDRVLDRLPAAFAEAAEGVSRRDHTAIRRDAAAIRLRALTLAASDPGRAEDFIMVAVWVTEYARRIGDPSALEGLILLRV